jgi:hypothetical protein
MTGMGMPQGNMGGMGMNAMGGFGNQFNTNANPMMGGGFGMGGPMGGMGGMGGMGMGGMGAMSNNYATGMPQSSGFAGMGGQGNFAAGPGPKPIQESFKKDGFNLIGENKKQ